MLLACSDTVDSILDGLIVGDVVVLDVLLGVHKVVLRTPFNGLLHGCGHFHRAFRTFLGGDDDDSVGRA